VRDFVAGRIDALVLAKEADAGNPETVNLLLLRGCDLTLQPHETLFRGEPLAHLAAIKIRQRRGEELDRFILFDDPARFPEQARRFDVGGEYFAVAVDDIRPRGRDRVLRRAAASAVAVSNRRKHDQPSANHGKDRSEGEHGKANSRARLGGSIDIAAVKHAADQPLPPRLRGRTRHR